MPQLRELFSDRETAINMKVITKHKVNWIEN